MRQLVALKKNEQNKLALQFSEILKIDSLDDERGYKKVAISVFDHWLSREDAFSFLTNVDENEQAQRDRRHFDFNKELLSKTKVFTYKVKGRLSKKRPIFKRFLNDDSAISYVKPAGGRVSSKFYFKLVLPDLDALYYEGSDDTNYIYCRNDGLLSDVFEAARNHGLFVLGCD